jgi:hypothetical protein
LTTAVPFGDEYQGPLQQEPAQPAEHPQPAAMPLHIAPDMLAIYKDATDKLGLLNAKFSACRFALLDSFTTALQNNTYTRETKVFVCETHAPAAKKADACTYMLSSFNKAKDHGEASAAAAAAPAQEAADGGRLVKRRRKSKSVPDNAVLPAGAQASAPGGAPATTPAVAQDADIALIQHLVQEAVIDTARLATLQDRECSNPAEHMVKLGLVVEAPGVGTMLQNFVDALFYNVAASYRFATSDSRLAVLRAMSQECRFSPSRIWMQRGDALGDCLKARGGPWPSGLSVKADNIKQARKQLINSVFGVLRGVGDGAGLSSVLGCASMRRDGRLPTLLRNALPAAKFSAFVGHVHKATLIALPLDLTYAVFAEECHWYSERHYRLLQAACTLGFVDEHVRTLVGTLESGVPALSVEGERGKERDPTTAQKLDQIEATMLAQLNLKTIQMPARSRDMMNKRYEWILALLPELEAVLEPFTTPLFWWPVESNSAVQHECLHFIDMNAPPYRLQRCEALLDMRRVVKQ